MQIYLPIAEMAVPVEMILPVSMMVGFLSGLLGISGGFLTTPFLLFVGIPPAVAVGTQATQPIASSSSGVLGYFKRGHVDVKIALFMLVGGFCGALVGAQVFKVIKDLGQIDFTISVLYIVLLGFIGSMMAAELIRSKFFPGSAVRKEFNRFKPHPLLARLPFKMRFEKSALYISGLVPFFIGTIGGMLASILGIGGGFILVPAMIYLLGMPPYLVAGTSLFQMIFTTSFAVIMHATLNNTVDIVLAMILMVGGVIGAQIGLGCTRFVNGVPAKVILTVIILMVCLKLCLDMFMEPRELFSLLQIVTVSEGA